MNTNTSTLRKPARRGLSLLELIAAITILGILAAVVIPRFGDAALRAKKEGCKTLKLNIEVQSQLWNRTKGTWPASDLGDIGGDRRFFPEGLPVCPVDGSSYTINNTTGRVAGHTH